MDNPERFLAGVNGVNGDGSVPQGVNEGENEGVDGAQAPAALPQLGVQAQNPLEVMQQLQALAQQNSEPVVEEEPTVSPNALLEMLFNNPEVLRRIQDVIGKKNTEKIIEDLKEYKEEKENEV